MYFRKYYHDEKFFEKWSSDLAYILGFTFSDGNIYHSCLSYSISQKDIAVLNYIKTCLKTNALITLFERKNKNTKSISSVCRLRINSVDLINVLAKKYNLHPNKTQTASINFNIPKKFRGDFVRGFFDGDGWVYNRRNSVESGFCTASKQLINQLHILCGNIGRLRTRNKKSIKNATMNLYSIEFGTSDSMKLRNLMYKNKSFCLQRKKEKFWNFHIPSAKYWTKNQISIIKGNHSMPISELSKMIGKSEKSIKMKKFKLGLCPKRPIIKKELINK